MRRSLFFAPIVFSLAAWWGCTATSGDNGFEDNTGGAGGSSTTATSSSSAGGAPGTGGSGEGGSVIDLDAGNDVVQPLDDAGVCTGTSAQAELTPLDMIVVLDKSGSMSGTKWNGSTAALEAFVNDSNSAGIGVGLVFFPNDQSDDCNYADYANLDVAIGTLPGNSATLVSAIEAEDANGPDTPTYGALKGALYAATSYQDANPTHKVVVVLATDGDPNGCPDDSTAGIAALAKSARNYNGVQTYVIAVQGSSLANLNPIAAAGGTGQAYDVTSDVSLFAAKMAEIRQNALKCEFPIPPPPDMEELDPNKVNVNYTPGAGGNKTTLPRVDSKAQCGSGSGWYYDDNMAPTKIILCPTSCQTVQADPAANVDVLFGCKQVVH